MFIVPFTLFVITTYLRPRTQAELSYLIAAIEYLSGIWCLLFAPLTIQLLLIGLFLIRNATQLLSIIKPQKDEDSLATSSSFIHTIDIDASIVQDTKVTQSLPQVTQVDSGGSFSDSLLSDPVNKISASNSQFLLSRIGPAAASNQRISTEIIALTPITKSDSFNVSVTWPKAVPPHLDPEAQKWLEQQPTAITPPHFARLQYRGITYLKQM